MKYHRHLLLSSCEALSAVFFEDRHADKCIERYLKSNRKWGSRDRRFFAETVYDCVRWWRLYWYLVNEEAKPDTFPLLAASLWKRGLDYSEIEELQGYTPEILQKRMDSLRDPSILHSLPYWLFMRLQEELGETWEDLLPFINTPNDLVLRVNTLAIPADALMARLEQEDIQAERLIGTEQGLVVKERTNVRATTAFKEGLFEVQDGSSQLVAPFLSIEPGMRVIDACAGAGGKSLHIADILQNKGKVISMDIHQWKLDQLKLRARRNKYSNIEMKLIESNKTIKRLAGSADRLLLDVPCSGLGVLRRNPDTKWKLSPEKLDELQQMQMDILSNYGVMVKSGGLMLYSTCSILPSENQLQVDKFLKSNSQFTLLKQRTIYPIRSGFDGFYMALLRKF